MDKDIAIIGIGCNFPGGKYIVYELFYDNTVCICMSSRLPSQVRVLIISGKFLWRAGTVWYRFKMKDLIHQSGFILMRVNQEKHRRPKLLSLKGRNNQFKSNIKS